MSRASLPHQASPTPPAGRRCRTRTRGPAGGCLWRSARYAGESRRVEVTTGDSGPARRHGDLVGDRIGQPVEPLGGSATSTIPGTPRAAGISEQLWLAPAGSGVSARRPAPGDELEAQAVAHMLADHRGPRSSVSNRPAMALKIRGQVAHGDPPPRVQAQAHRLQPPDRGTCRDEPSSIRRCPVYALGVAEARELPSSLRSAPAEQPALLDEISRAGGVATTSVGVTPTGPSASPPAARARSRARRRAMNRLAPSASARRRPSRARAPSTRSVSGLLRP